MNAVEPFPWMPGLPDLRKPMTSLAVRALCSKHWRWLPERDLDLMAPLAKLNSRCRRAWLRGDAAALGWLAEQHRRRADARRLGELMAELESAP